jgi:hypothetical protein
MSDLDMLISVSMPERGYRAEVTSVTALNPDGTSRQEILRKCTEGEQVKLACESEDPNAQDCVAVFRKNGQQLGYVEWYRAAGIWWHIRRGGEITARIVALGSLDRIRSFDRNHQRRSDEHYDIGCLLQISEGDFPKDYIQFCDKSREIENLIRTGQQWEKTDPEQAIQYYRTVIDEIIKLDSISSLAKAWRSARYPINRLSLLLDRTGKPEEALQAIETYEQYDDRPVSLLTGDLDAIKKRKERMLVKLGKAKPAPKTKTPMPPPVPEAIEHFFEEVRGITKDNRDRTSRQKIIRDYIGKYSPLLFEPDENSEESAIKVTTRDGRQVGYLLRSLAKDIVKLKARGYRYSALADEILEWEPFEGHTHFGISALVLEVPPNAPDEQIREYARKNFSSRGQRFEKILLEPLGLKPQSDASDHATEDSTGAMPQEEPAARIPQTVEGPVNQAKSSEIIKPRGMKFGCLSLIFLLVFGIGILILASK